MLRPSVSALFLVLSTAVSYGATRYDLDVTVTPLARSISVTGTLDVPRELRHGNNVTLRLRSAFALTTTSGTATQGTERGGITEWTVTSTAELPQQIHFTAAAADIHDQSILHVDAESAFTTANELPWYPLVTGATTSVGVLRFHVPDGMVVAAPGTERRRGEFVVDVPLLFWFAAAHYTVITGEKSSAYVLKERPLITGDLARIDAILQVLSREFGPYPYGHFRLVEVSRAAAQDAGGFNAFGSAGSIVTRSTSLDQPFNTAYYAHELGHQWWSNLVSLRWNTTRGNYLLDEAMAQYASMRGVEALEGDDAAERYRRTGYPGFHDDLYCYCAAGYFRLAAAGLDRPLLELPDDALSDRLARNKGGWIWYMLREEVGPERFRQILHAITAAHAFGDVSWDEVVGEFRKNAGHEIQWFFEQWIDRAGAPEFSVETAREGDHLRVTVRQPPPYYRAALEIELRGASTLQTLRVTTSGAETTTNVAIPFRLVETVLDPHYRILRWTPQLHAQADAAAAFLATRQALGAGGDIDKAASRARTLLAALPPRDTYAARFLTEYSLGLIELRKKSWREAAEHFAAAISTPTRLAEVLPSVYLRSAAAMKELGNVEGARRAISDGLSAASAAPEPAGSEATDTLEALAATLPAR
jgi:tetratricopeptide (TPR) repeat protein